MQSSVSSSQDLFLSWAPTTKDQLDFGTPGNWTLFEGFENEQACSQVSHPSSIPLRNGSLAATKRYLEFGTTSNLDFQEGSIGKKSQARLSCFEDPFVLSCKQTLCSNVEPPGTWTVKGG